MRFAGSLLGYLGRVARPEGKMGVALEYGGNALGALMSGAMFGGGDLGRSAAIGAEDLGIGLLGSIGGRVAGDLVARKLLKVKDPRQIQMAQLAGSMPLEMGLAVLSPRPILDGVMEKRMQEAQARQGVAPQAATQPAPAQAAQPRQPQGMEVGQLPAELGLRSQGLASGGSAQDEIRKIMDDLLAGQPQEVRDAVNSAMGAR